MDAREEILDETEAIRRSSYYNLRSKRRKLNSSRSEELSIVGDSNHETYKRKNCVMFLPTEILSKILNYVCCEELGASIRLVNRRFKIVAEDILSSRFRNIKRRIQRLTESIFFAIESTQEDEEIKCCCKLLNCLEILDLEYEITIATIWRYVYNKYYKGQDACMYAGLLTDTYDKFLWNFTHTPLKLYESSFTHGNGYPNEVTKIIQFTKSFCVHFDKLFEEPSRKAFLHGGCKLLDILDVATYAEKNILYEHHDGKIFSGKYSYFFNYSWFIALPIRANKEMTLSQKQRMMYMRLRRIVMAHTDMWLMQSQYEREVMVRLQREWVKKPGNNVYTGYGDVEDTFFYYGVMNHSAYEQKFKLDEGNNEGNDDDDDENEDEAQQQIVQEIEPPNNDDRNDNDMQDDPNAEVAQVNSDDNVFYRIPFLGLRIDATVECSLQLAPEAYLKKLDFNTSKKLWNKRPKKRTKINLSFHCAGACYPRLPDLYIYDFDPQ